ncbi:MULTISPECIES: NAD-dependent epimerase/dehydratase family protein [Rhizobium]|uniref:NAD-dependent epimerase/dehydratase n=1 Tax=Rhizobium favelukesii TaxID=348824 RepID=W6RV09_9HYPH|nr:MULTISPECIES: NAD(P)-dependent oxidoreductase [Rhizobium]MCA0805669.1 NAD(P)-dependent oxidoreductase [Rhizobium sp. T1473]MCS0459174.1 NAD(P)-dependent oxidoreductase [Rhizobium favelukesii]UFS78999.1 NAD(P)-dependent oxidoreductase [Rhizobium sp. T136]CDM62483.1 NAD-dependent epimerase/dehydratase [Rhizobium favelukesii]
MPANTVLVTGATGRIGRIVAADLLERGYRVRATTSRPRAIDEGKGVDWRKVDFLGNPNYDDLVAGCDAIIHLAAELGKKDRMKQVNVQATRALAAAAERANVAVFCYASSVSVYGSGRSVNVDEESEVLTPDRDVRSEYWALDYVREYGRTKLAGELALRDVAKKVRYVILRPAVVVDISQMISVRDWNPVKRMLAAHRHAHHIYVGDVSDALIWFVCRGIAGQSQPGSVSVYNLAEDDYPAPRHVDFMRKAFAVTGDQRFRTVAFPWIADWLHDFLRFRTLPLRSPLWRMRFSNERLKAAGYRFRFGMAKAEELALGQLRLEAHHRPQQGLGEEPA